jgi:hypothetical protein
LSGSGYHPSGRGAAALTMLDYGTIALSPPPSPRVRGVSDYRAQLRAGGALNAGVGATAVLIMDRRRGDTHGALSTRTERYI